ncbi:MAG: 2-C-methyl-D-erythritol 4-phosphate cytidylyltransferase [Planctomycetota bacterium]|nr:MAG: 2-C-methyl-D-erythritol 4-phosphate cytidylyltransferase [Planctomycetota bacterium]
MSTFAVILPAAGAGTRFRDPVYKKPFAPLAGRAVWLHSAHRFTQRDDVRQVIVVISPDDREYFEMKFTSDVAILGIDVVEGGQERVDSVGNGLAKVREDIDFVCVHDAARPCLSDLWIDAVFDAAKKSGAAILGIPVNDTIKKVGEKKQIEATVPRTGLWAAQTPQVFRRDWLVEAYANRPNDPVTDDAQLIESLGKPVTVVHGSPMNIKITRKEDLKLAEQILKVLPKPRLDRPAHPFADDDLWR